MMTDTEATEHTPHEGNGTVDDSEEHGFIYGYVTAIERYSEIIAFLIFTITVGCGAIAVLINGLPSFDDPILGIEIRGTDLSARELSFVKFLKADEEIFSPIPREYLASRPDVRMAGNATNLPRRPNQSPRNTDGTCPTPDTNLLQVVFESSDGAPTLFRADHLMSICRQEEQLVRSHPKFIQSCSKIDDPHPNKTNNCCPTWSLGYAVALLNNKSSCFNITNEDVTTAWDILRKCSPFYTTGKLDKGEVQPSHELPSECVRERIVYNTFNFLTPITFADELERGTDDLAYSLSFSPIPVCLNNSCQEKALDIYDDNFQNIESLNDGITRVVSMNFFLKNAIFQRTLFSDFQYIGTGIAVVALIIWGYTGSFLIMVGSLLNMVFSVVLAYFIYHMVFQIHFFHFFNLATLVLVIGIGADDTFVYVDLWKSAKEECGELGRRGRVLALHKATKHAILTLMVTTLTTSSALFATVASKLVVHKVFAVFAGTTIAANFIYTITWLPAIIVLQEKYWKFSRKTKSVNGAQHSAQTWWIQFVRLCNYIANTPKRIITRSLLKLIYPLRFVWLVLFAFVGASGIISVFFYPSLQFTETGITQLFRDHHPFEKYDQIYVEDPTFGSFNENNLPIFFIWGLLRTQKQNPWNPLDLGSLDLDRGFHFGNVNSQKWLSQFCTDLKRQSFYGNRSSFCFIDSFKEWMGRPCVALEERSCCENTEFPFEESTFQECSKRYSIFICRANPCSSYSPGLRFDRNGTVNAMYLHFDSSLPYTTEFKPVDNFWTDLRTWYDTQIENAPVGLSGGWTYSQSDVQLRFHDVQDRIMNDTLLTIGIALATATIVLLLTIRNLVITLFAVATITLTLTSTIGSLVWLGWELNVFESSVFTIAVGLSVDFSLHFGVAYGVSGFRDRRNRTEFVIRTFGSSITAAALSTFAAGAAMIPAVVLVYHQIGIFLVVVMSFSWLYSIFFFLPLCIVFGPTGDNGHLFRLSFRSGHIR